MVIIKPNRLHIVSFNIPFPPDYGGVIDIYYKIKALSELGVEIILHCYQYNRDQSPELLSLCKEVHYYDRRQGLKYYFSTIPYIINTRSDGDLLKRLTGDLHPVIFEGIHTTAFAHHPDLAGKKLMIRAHNIEHEYYHGLYRAEIRPDKKLFYLTESYKLRQYENLLSQNLTMAAISPRDFDYFGKRFRNVIYLPPFHPCERLTCKPGSGKYILFHADLSVAENISSVKDLIKKVFSQISTDVIIAGRNPPVVLKENIRQFSNIRLIPNPGEREMIELLENAHINILHSFQTSGIKLKLIHSLFRGRHCIVNPPLVNGSGLNELCHITVEPENTVGLINRLMDVPFGAEEINQRQVILLDQFSNIKNAHIICDMLSD